MNSLHHLTKRKNFKRDLVIGFIIASLLFWAGLWLYEKFYVSTDDAYLNANVVQISPRVTGQITKVYVQDNQYVIQGQPLFGIDPTPFKIMLDKAQAQVALNQAQFINAQNTAVRKTTLARKHFVSTQDNDNAQTALQTADASLRLSQASLEQASLDINWTKVTAPTSGWITNLTTRVGDVVPANQPLFALISDKEFWVDANFKETEIANIKPDQYAKIIIDMYPDHPMEGKVASISGGTGSVFSLLPPQNATGNWVKITQRIPVRVDIQHPNPAYPLRIGSSATIKIHLHRYINKDA